MTRFIQIHWLASYPATLLNRDDVGFAKRMPFGGVTRSRISSQCLKRHWRLAGAGDQERARQNPWALQNLHLPLGVRTKEVVEQKILPLALERQSADPDTVIRVTEALLKELYGKNAVDPKKRQILFIGEPEIDYMAQLAVQALALADAAEAEAHMVSLLKKHRKNLRQLRLGAGLGAAMFGRMVTSDPAANTDAAIHVAHALSVHGMERDLDFMTVVDDLKSTSSNADFGAAGIFDVELTSGLYYGYVVVDVAALLANLADDEVSTSKVIEHLVHLIAQVSPGAKKGSTAPYAWAEYMMIECGDRQPRTLANAFRRAVPLQGDDLLGATVNRLAEHVRDFDRGYGAGEQRRHLCVQGDLAPVDIEMLDLPMLAEWAAQQVSGN